MLDTLTALKSRYAANPAAAHQDDLDEKIDGVERALAARSAQFRVAQLHVDLATVQQAMPPDAVLLEYLDVSPTMDGEWDRRHVAGLVILAKGEPVLVDLGEAAAILEDVTAMRAVLGQADHPDTNSISKALHARLLAPLLKHAPNTNLLLLGPVPDLLAVPWAALVDAQGHAVVQQHAVVLLGSGRDILRLKEEQGRAGGSMVVANPDFGNVDNSPAETRSTKRGLRDLADMEFSPLPGTAQEAKAVAPLLKDARTLSGKAATEEAFKQVVAPRVLHVATHGFFIQRAAPSNNASFNTRGLKLKTGELKQPAPPPEVRFMDMWLKSGLAMSNANTGTTTSDGVVTALELSAMNLWGTRLAVLSACETGLGKKVSGDAVLGLRRALVLAGAQSQVVSLWNVDDDATRDLMVAFYKNLSKGMGRAESLRQAQLTLRKNPKFSHPYYWSAFTFGGDWRPLK